MPRNSLDNLEATIMWKDSPIIYFKVVDGYLHDLHAYEENKHLYPLEFRREEILIQDLNSFVDYRILPSTRQNLYELLKAIGIPYYDWDLIIKKNHGLCTDDCYWFKFPGETITYKDLNWRD